MKMLVKKIIIPLIFRRQLELWKIHQRIHHTSIAIHRYLQISEIWHTTHHTSIRPPVETLGEGKGRRVLDLEPSFVFISHFRGNQRNYYGKNREVSCI